VQRRLSTALARQQPARPHHRVARERDLGAGGEDADLAALRVVDEHRLGEAKVGCDALTIGRADRRAVEEHPQRVPATLTALTPKLA
jgi:hypothetical protein